MERLSVQQRRKLNERLRLHPLRCAACQQSEDLAYEVGQARVVCRYCGAGHEVASLGLTWRPGGPRRTSYWTTSEERVT